MSRYAKAKRAWAVLAVLVVAGLSVAAVAIADNVQNDVVAGGNDTVEVGKTTTVNYRIAANNGDGEPGCNAKASSPSTVTINAPAGVTATPSSLTFTSCATDKPVQFSATSAGDYDITVSVSDTGPGTFNVNPAKFTLHVVNPTVSDTTPPTVTPTVTGTLGNNGWYTSDVTVSWFASDNESAITSDPCPTTTISSDTSGQVVSCTATSAGGTTTESVTIKRDATNPSISGSASPAPNDAGWNNTPVAVSFSCSDATSEIASCGPDLTLTDDGAGQSATGTATDNAGNSNTATVAGINIDRTVPTVAVTGVSHGATYKLGSVPAAGCSTTDALSGVKTNASLSTSGGPVGAVTATCSGAEDNAGNANSAQVTYKVEYPFDGFYQPIDMGGVFNKAKAGSAIPVKFSLDGAPVPGSNTPGDAGVSPAMTGAKTVKISCPSAALVDLLEETASASTSGLKYDPVADQWVYVWKTSTGLANTCQRLEVALADGTTKTANFQFTK